MDTEASCAPYSVFLKPIQAQRYWPIPSLHRVAVALAAILWLSGGSDMAAAQAITRVATINTLAGNGTAGYLGDSGPATSAELNGPLWPGDR
jgi:hypothetical protein